MKKRKKMIAWILVVLSVVLVGGYFAIGNYFYDLAVNAHTNKSFLSAGSKQKPLSKKEERKKENKAFLEYVKSDAWYVTSSDKLKLKLYAADYKQPTKTNKWAKYWWTIDRYGKLDTSFLQ